jgi:hypothetical protein
VQAPDDAKTPSRNNHRGVHGNHSTVHETSTNVAWRFRFTLDPNLRGDKFVQRDTRLDNIRYYVMCSPPLVRAVPVRSHI